MTCGHTGARQFRSLLLRRSNVEASHHRKKNKLLALHNGRDHSEPSVLSAWSGGS